MADQAGAPRLDASIAPTLLVPCGILYAIAIILFIVRIYTRIFLTGRLYADDYVIAVAVVLAFIEFPLVAVSCHYGLGQHDYFVPPQSKRKALQYLYAAIFLWYPAVSLIRVSVACALLRLKWSSRTWTTVFWVAILVQIVVGTGAMTAVLLQCRPLRSIWEPVPEMKCWPAKYTHLYSWIFSGTSIANDILFALVPITFLWKLQRPIPERIVVCLLMALGLMASAAAIMMVYTSERIDVGGELLVTLLDLSLCAKLEELLGIIAACAPCLKSPAEKTLRHLGIIGARSVTLISSYGLRYFGDVSQGFRLRSVERVGGRTVDVVARVGESNDTPSQENTLFIKGSPEPSRCGKPGVSKTPEISISETTE